MKKRLAAITLVLLLIFGAVLLWGCDKAPDDSRDAGSTDSKESTESTEAAETTSEHTHFFSEWSVIKEPSCEEEGSRERLCNSCGERETEKLDAAGHTPVLIPAVAATCLEDGVSEGERCGVCDEMIKEPLPIKATGHTKKVIERVDSTCTEAGRAYREECGICGYVIAAEEEAIPPKGHDYSKVKVTKTATCYENGTKKFTCSRCGDSYTESYELESFSDTELYERSVKFVGEVRTYDAWGEALGLGACFVWDENGMIVTNYHVIDGACSAEVVLDGKTYEVKSVLGYDPEIDIAMLKIDAKGLTEANICNRDHPVGTTVYAIGSPRGLTNTYSKGIITYSDRELEGVRYVQHDASITNGNSGGPLINSHGEVIGINTMTMAESQNLNFAIRTSHLNDLKYGDPVTLEELFLKNYSSSRRLLLWLSTNYNFTSEDGIQYLYTEEGWNDVYSIGYDISRGLLYCAYVYNYDSGEQLLGIVFLESSQDDHLYTGMYTDGIDTNTTVGLISGSGFTEDTPLTYELYEGDAWVEEELMEVYQAAVVNALASFGFLTDIHVIGVTPADFGFLNF